MNREEFAAYINAGGDVAVPVDLDVLPIGSTFVTMAGKELVRLKVVSRTVGGCPNHGSDCTCVDTDIGWP